MLQWELYQLLSPESKQVVHRRIEDGLKHLGYCAILEEGKWVSSRTEKTCFRCTMISVKDYGNFCPFLESTTDPDGYERVYELETLGARIPDENDLNCTHYVVYTGRPEQCRNLCKNKEE